MSQLQFLNLYSVYPGWFLGCARVTLLKLQPGLQEADVTAPEVGELSCQLPGAALHGRGCSARPVLLLLAMLHEPLVPHVPQEKPV